MAKKLIHYGDRLKKNMEDKGISKARVMELLGINHYTTLEQRFVDAKFTFEELATLRKADLI